MFHPVVGDDGHGLRQLQHGEAVVALSNAQRNGFPGVPLLLFRALVILAFPLLAGQDAAHFPVDVDAGMLPKAQGLHEVMHGVYPQLIGERIEVDVARLHDGTPHVHDAALLVLGAAKTVTAKHVETRVIDQGLWRARAGFQGGQRHERLVSGARWVGTAQSAVKQRLVDGLIEHLPVFLVNAFDEQVGVKRGFADKRQHFAGLGVQRHQRSPAGAKHVFDQLLQLDVDGQHHHIARRRRVAGQLAHSAPTGRSFNPLHPGQAVQRGFKTLLNAQFANVFGPPVVGLVIAVLYFFLFGLVDAPDITNHVAGQLTVGVAAKQTGLDFDTGEAETLCRKTGDLGIGQTRTDWQGLEVLGLLHELLEATPVARCDVNHAGKFVDGFFHATRLGGRNFQSVGRVVGGQHHTIAVFDQSTVGHDGHDGGAVAFRLRTQIIMAHDLQIRHPQSQQEETT